MKTKFVLLLLICAAPLLAQKKIIIPFLYISYNWSTPIISAQVQGVDKLFLVDSGACISIIGDRFKNTFVFPTSEDKSEIKISGLGGEPIRTTKKYKVPLFGSFGEFVCGDISALENNISYISDVDLFAILGSDFLRAHKGIIDYDKKTLTLTIF